MGDELETVNLELPMGKIKGCQRKTIYGGKYYCFEGIPFAKPPLAGLRFKAPEEPEPWTHVLDCTQSKIKPVQKSIETGLISGTEDCLYLNVYAKNLDGRTKLPVMVFIYGGGFFTGYATRDRHGPDYLLNEDIILVTFNYRLCSLGFLSLADPECDVPGNAGLKDQIMAIKWVKQHISHFNGDDNNMTVFGNSAGGASTHFLMCSEQTRNLFHKAIPMSGCVLNFWAITEASDHAYRLAKYHNFEGENNDKQVLEYLQNLEPEQLVDHSIISVEELNNGNMFAFGPCIEAYITDHCVVSQAPLEMIKTAWGNDIPMMLGGCSSEGLLMYSQLREKPQIITNLLKNPEFALPKEIRAAYNAKEVQELAAKILQLYFDDNVEAEEDTIYKCMDFFSYKLFWHDFHRTMLARLKYAKAPTYVYRFDFDSVDFNHHRNKYCGNDPVRGAAHADELSYLFFSRDAWKLEPDTAEFKTIQRMVAMWAAFAKSSNPTCDFIMPIVWKPISKEEPNIALNISEEIELKVLPEMEKLAVWDTIYKDNLV